MSQAGTAIKKMKADTIGDVQIFFGRVPSYAEADCRWFERHPKRKFRLRELRPNEIQDDLSRFTFIGRVPEGLAYRNVPCFCEADVAMFKRLSEDKRPNLDERLKNLWYQFELSLMLIHRLSKEGQ